MKVEKKLETPLFYGKISKKAVCDLHKSDVVYLYKTYKRRCELLGKNVYKKKKNRKKGEKDRNVKKTTNAIRPI